MKTSIKNLLSAVALTAFLSLGFHAEAQLNVNAAGNVGIGANANNNYKFYLENNNNSLYTAYLFTNSNTTGYLYGLRNYVGATGTGGRLGIYNTTYHNSTGTGSTYGIYNYATNYSTSNAYGIYNYLYAGSNSGARYGLYNYLGCGTGTGTLYALYSGVSCGGDYAGYFNGNVFISGTLTLASDAAKKENVQSMEGALALVNQLDAKTYNYVQDANMTLPSEKQFGFLAQDVEKVMPHLVKEVENPAAPVQSHDENGEFQESGPQEYETVKSVNYIGMIPVLVKAVQEQQALIEQQSELLKKQQAEIAALKAEMSKH